MQSSVTRTRSRLAHRSGSDHRSQRRHRVAHDLLGPLDRRCLGGDASGRALLMTYAPVMDAKQVDASSLGGTNLDRKIEREVAAPA